MGANKIIRGRSKVSIEMSEGRYRGDNEISYWGDGKVVVEKPARLLEMLERSLYGR